MQKSRNKPVRKFKSKEACRFCRAKLGEPVKLDWREYGKLREFLSPRGRILARNFTGTCMKHQRLLSKVIKQARHLGLLPFVVSE